MAAPAVSGSERQLSPNRTISRESMDNAEHVTGLTESELRECIRQMQHTPAEDELAHMKIRKGSLVNESCSWIGREAEDFIQSLSPVMWIHGDPGKGKTMMSIFLIQHLRDAYGLGSVYFFFCQHDSGEHRTAGAILRALICQILLNPALPLPRRLSLGRHLVESYKIQGDTFLSSNASEESLKRVLRNILAELDQTFIIVDGLDECDTQSVSSLTELMLPMTMNKAIKYILTSRNQPKVLHQILKRFTDIHLERPEHDARVRRGVKAFVHARFLEFESGTMESTSTESKMKDSRSIPNSQSIEKRVSDNAEDSFIWAAMMYDQLRNEGLEFAMELFDDCPADLGALYERIVSRVLMLDLASRSSSAQNRRLSDLRIEICRRILRVLCVAQRSLTEDEMEEAIDFNGSGARFPFRACVEDCGGLIVVKNSKIRFIHLSAKNYMLTEEAQQKFDIMTDDAHAQLAMNCMAYLEVFAETHDAASLVHSHFMVTRNGAPRAEREFVGYAITYFMGHAIEALKSSKFSVPMLERLNTFFKSPGGCLFYEIFQKTELNSQFPDLEESQLELSQGQISIVAARFGVCQLLDLDEAKCGEDGFTAKLVTIAATHDHVQIISTIIDRLKVSSSQFSVGRELEAEISRLRDVAADTSLIAGSVNTWKYTWSREADCNATLLKAVCHGHPEIVKILVSSEIPSIYEEFYLSSDWCGPFAVNDHGYFIPLDSFNMLYSLPRFGNANALPEEPVVLQCNRSDVLVFTHTDFRRAHCSGLEFSDTPKIAFFRLHQANLSEPEQFSDLVPGWGRFPRHRQILRSLRVVPNLSSLDVNSSGAPSSQFSGIRVRIMPGDWSFSRLEGSDQGDSKILPGSALVGSEVVRQKDLIHTAFDLRIVEKLGDLLEIAIEKSRIDIAKILIESGFPVGLSRPALVTLSLSRGYDDMLAALVRTAPAGELDLSDILHRGTTLERFGCELYACIDVVLAAGASGDMPMTGKDITIMCRLAQEANYIALHYLLKTEPVVRSKQCFNQALIEVLTQLSCNTEYVGPYSSSMIRSRVTKQTVRLCFYMIQDRFGDLPLGWEQHETASGWRYFNFETGLESRATWQDPRVHCEPGKSLDDFWSDERPPVNNRSLERYLDENYGLDSISPQVSSEEEEEDECGLSDSSSWTEVDVN